MLFALGGEPSLTPREHLAMNPLNYMREGETAADSNQYTWGHQGMLHAPTTTLLTMNMAILTAPERNR